MTLIPYYKKEQIRTKETKEDKGYEKEYLLCFSIEIKADGLNIYKKYIHSRSS